jgi:hypothetical protein
MGAAYCVIAVAIKLESLALAPTDIDEIETRTGWGQWRLQPVYLIGFI